MTFVYKLLLFICGTIAIVWISRTAFRDIHHHGFYRFLSWETILALFLMNVNYWFVDPFSLGQILSWAFLIVSLFLIYWGVRQFRKTGGVGDDRADPQLLGVEKTTKLVTSGIYAYIRHPFYSSLLFLGWGIWLKHTSWIAIILGLTNTLLLMITARREESENIAYFGDQYRQYMQHTRMFIPYIF